MDEHPSPAGADMFREPLDLDQHDLSTPRQTHELLSPNVLFLESHRLFSPPLTILPDRLMTGSRFAMKLIGSPWSLFQSVLHSTRSINADTSMPPLQVPRGTDAGDIQPSLYDLAYSMLPHSSSSIAAKNLGSALELIVSTYFPADEAQRLQYVPAFSRNSFIEQLVTTAFGMVANGVLANEGIEQFLNILKNYTPRPLLRRIFESETSTARAALEMLLKDVVTRGDEEALDFLLALGIRKEHLSGSVGGKLLQYFVPFGKTNMTKRIVLAGADPNVGEDWRNPLVRAAWERDLELVEILLKAGAEDNHRFKESRSTALSRAVVNNHRRCVSLLLESGATVDTCIVDDIKGWESGCDEPPTLSAVDYAYLVGYTQVHQLLLVRSAKAKSHLTISGIISAARAGLNSLEAYLEKRAYDNAKEQTTLLQNALSSAIRHNTGDPAIYVLLDFGVDPDTPTLTLLDQLPLCQAIPDNRLVRRLLDAGANLENPQIILAAADYENIDCLGLLIMNGLNLQTLGSIGLGEAILSGNVDIMKVLLHFGAPAGGYDIMGSSLVAVAAENGNREALHLLLQHGADVNDGGSDSRRPINSAVVKGDLEMVKILVENGALLDHPGLRDKRCRTVLEEWASEVDELRISDLFTFLLERGAPVNAPEVKRCAPHWNSLLTTLILNSAEDDLIRQVLEKGAHVNDRLPTVGGARTPIQAAAEMGKIDLVREFHEKGADINAPPGFRLGRTALQAACSARQANMEVVVYLLDNKVDINAKAGYDGGLTAIQGAASHGNIELVSLLLDRGADLNAEAAPMNGRTALEGAAEHGRLDMVYLLLNAGAKCQREGTTGYDSAVELAKEEGHWEIARLLSSFGGVAS
ncbi:ankyrin repeat-containing domain protein [Cladorrhinum samala]|uniref:Ankyrin repeat-containing domain protein n=1 Tax=Cladorrhinum samala TaxID=585594 RepID=A0AAV9HZU2_9PEZI|nr:ankyrin repeat-containing domain protein [Cladorrhinum samala]